ncbi:MAG TPA: SGNH/GDSL hydrolase family protein [Bryobacteraceae bacterium]|nr:SGNH/GDSL hydrolase family protein [Bryobacteraceae bacterium]
MTGKILCLLIALLCFGQARRMVTEKIEWTYSDQPAHANPALPNVLLIGDSITRAYYPAVAKNLDGKANCYYFATSASIGDERLPLQLAEYYKMIQIAFSVVHLNNGMHGWSYTEEEYAQYFREALAAVRAGAPGAKLVWASTTPVRKDKADGATNARIEARNKIAARVIGRETKIDDQYSLMKSHEDLHSDDVHYNSEGSTLQAAQVAEIIIKYLQAGAK